VFRYQFPHFRVVTDEKKLDVSLVVVGRTKHYGGPFRITDQADLYADQFEIMGLTTQSGFRYLSYIPTLWFGKLRGTEGVHYWKANSIVCEPLDAKPVYAQVDGEPLARLPVEFKIIPRALKLLVPKDSATAKIPAQTKN
jgi:diacylglycerol kinase family enzyme